MTTKPHDQHQAHTVPTRPTPAAVSPAEREWSDRVQAAVKRMATDEAYRREIARRLS